ncbi:MAG: molybdopterin-dependent oxidoreductase [Cellvibrionaceae bacterium]
MTDKTSSSSTHASTEKWTKTTCAYCGVGCGIEAKLNNTGEIEVRGDETHPANYGRLCSKGLALGETVTNRGRLLEPSISGKNVSWDNALSHVADKFSKTIQKYGADSVAFYVSGQLLTEDYYVANKLMKGYIGSANIDTNSRLCMSSSVAGHKRAFGSDTVPNCYEDFELADMVVLVGSNLAWCHPVIYQRLKAAKEARPDLKIIVVDPRETDSCELADLHLAIQPGADVALFNGLLNYLAEHNHIDHDYVNQHTQGFSDALNTAQKDTGESGLDFLSTARITGIPIAYLETFYQWFANTDKVLTVYSQGVNQSSAGVDKVNSIINCHLATGRIGKEGCGPFSITGQPNAMGGREVGGLANMLAAHMELGNPEHKKVVEEFWQVENVAQQQGLKAVDLFDAIDSGKVRAVWIMATNPVVSMPDSDKVKKALEQCPLVVVSDCIADTDTTRCADVLLPAMGWAEKSGTVTNSERRISRQRQLIASSGQAKPDWWIMCQVALRMGYPGFNFTSAADIFREYASMTGYQNNGQRDLDISALSTLNDEAYEELEPQQWPLIATDNGITQQQRFFSEGDFYTVNKKANIIPVSYRPPMTQVSQQFPTILNTGRIRDQWHTMTRTGLAPKLGAHKPEPYVQINPQDARCFQLKEGDIAQLNSEWGQAKARAVITSEMNPGQVFMPIHWTSVESSEGRVCSLVSPDVDPISGQPELKFTPIAIKPWLYNSEALIIVKEAIDVTHFDYWVKRNIEGGYLYYLATENKERRLATDVQQLPLFNSAGNSITFDNKNTDSYRSAKVVNGELLAACIVAPKIHSSDFAWLDTLLVKELNTDIQRSILSGVAAASLISGKQICACKQVGELTIKDAIQHQGCMTIETIGEYTQAGTGCGSCIPEVKQLIQEYGDKAIAVAV